MTKTAKKLRITQTGSAFGQKPGMLETLVGLGLGPGKRHKTRELADTPETRGMIRKVGHLVEVEEG